MLCAEYKSMKGTVIPTLHREQQAERGNTLIVRVEQLKIAQVI